MTAVRHQQVSESKQSAQKMADAIRIAYNFTPPHMALKGKTPVEASRLIPRLGQNRRKSLIIQSVRSVETERNQIPRLANRAVGSVKLRRSFFSTIVHGLEWFLRS